MRIGESIPFYQIPALSHYSRPAPAQEAHRQAGPGVVVDISPEGWAAYARDKVKSPDREGRTLAAASVPYECKTCGSRTYKDVSDDPSVSFQTPTHISPGQAAASVASHESEHAANEQVKADREGREIISQTVTLKTSICPECKRVYVSGGATYTISRQSSE
ncbi:MAG: hypothetical protein FWC45_03345 [Treponema sp.]|nr:hypothetical protein [Treponema sp.]